MQVIKISGAQLDAPDFLNELVQAMRNVQSPTVIVHGGGKEISQLQKLYGIQPQQLDGLRVTDEWSLEIVKLALCGAVNPRIVTALMLGGLEAQGLSGLDRGLIRAKKYEHPDYDLGRVGEVTSVRADIILELLGQGVIPVIAPICLGDDGEFNVNADHVAGAVAGAIGAERLIFLTNVPGVMQDDFIIPRLTPAETEKLIEEGVIQFGMIPKVRTAIEGLKGGVGQVLITDLGGLSAPYGTTFVS